MQRIALAASVLLLSGFAWPGEAERLVGELTHASTPRDKRDALRRLGELGVVPEAVAPFAQDADPGVRADALRLLRRAGPRDPSPEVRLVQVALDPALALDALDDPEPKVRIAALHAVRDVRALIRKLDDDALEVRLEAARVLASMPQARAALLGRIDDVLPELRAASIEALGQQHGADVEVALAHALHDRDRGVVLAAIRGYRRQGLALPTVSTDDPQLAVALRKPAWQWNDPAWLAVLERTVMDDQPVQTLESLERSLPRGTTLAIDPLREWLQRAPAELAPRIEALIARCRAER
jgi:hypothetical protein